MRFVQLTPGTGNFYCGNCVRDHALVKALGELGVKGLLAPMYLPVVADEDPPADARAGVEAVGSYGTRAEDAADIAGREEVVFGGVNAYLQQKLAIFRHTPAWIDRLFNARWLLRLASKKASMTQARDLGEMTLSMLRGEEGRQAKELRRLAAWLRAEHRPQVVGLSNLLLAGLAGPLKRALGVPVVVTMHGEDAFLDSLPSPDRERAWETLARACRDVDAFIAVSGYYGGEMSRRLGLESGRVHVVHNGVSFDDYPAAAARATPPNAGAPVLGYLARMCHGKGLHTLVEAFILLKRGGEFPGLRLHVAGTKTRADDAYIAQQRGRLEAAGLAGEALFLPNLSRSDKLRFLHELSLLSVPAHYGESFGLYVVEAWGAGVPVVQPRHAAFPELIEATGGGLLFEVENPASLAAAASSLLRDEGLRRSMGERARALAMERFSSQAMARGVLRVLESVSRPIPTGPGA